MNKNKQATDKQMDKRLTNRFWNLEELNKRAGFVVKVMELSKSKPKLSLSDIQEKLHFHCRQTIWNIIEANK